MATFLNPAIFLHLPLLTSNGISLGDLLMVFSDYALRILTSDPLLLVSVIVKSAIVYHVLSFLLSNQQVPAFGFPHWLPAGRIYGGARFFVDSSTMLSEGYNASKSTVFRIPRWQSWVYVLSGDKLVEEFHRYSDKSLSLLESAKDELQIPYTMGLPVHDDPYHLPILRHKLTRNLNFLVSEIMDEAVPAFDAIIGQNCPPRRILHCRGLHSITTIVARTFNRILVGPDVCRNVDYNKVSIQFAVSTIATSTVINLFPSFLHPLIGRLTSRFSSSVQKAIAHIGPLVEERRASMSNGTLTKEEMDTDFLWWFLAAAQGEQASTEALVARILVINAATIHTSSMTLTQALINLALHPEWAVRLREEATSAFSRHGWSRHMLKELSVMDCFLKESMRINGLGSMGFPRKAMETLQFSDGTVIPAGSLVSPAFGAHFDSAYYQDPLTFDPTRFMEGTPARKSEAGGMVNTSSHFLPFGHGKHTCVRTLPGRFVASHLLKTFMSHVVMNYEISLVDSQRPKDLWFGIHCIPNVSFSFTFRRLEETTNL
ncbi:cytochrome P450 [Armillaria nabsnona]|nr:cytochrome P450 [Armillaria nabsnona]